MPSRRGEVDVEGIRISSSRRRRDTEKRAGPRTALPSLDPGDRDIVRARRLAERAALERTRRRACT
jgi:hypothetical protein